MAGTGPSLSALKVQAGLLGLGGSVRFLGVPAAPGALLKGCKVFLLLSRPEAVLNSLLEAIATKPPKIASRVCDIPEVIEDGVTSIPAKRDDPAELAAAIQRLLGHPDEAYALGRCDYATLHTKGLTLYQGVRTLLETYESLAGIHMEKPDPALVARLA